MQMSGLHAFDVTGLSALGFVAERKIGMTDIQPYGGQSFRTTGHGLHLAHLLIYVHF